MCGRIGEQCWESTRTCISNNQRPLLIASLVSGIAGIVMITGGLAWEGTPHTILYSGIGILHFAALSSAFVYACKKPPQYLYDAIPNSFA